MLIRTKRYRHIIVLIIMAFVFLMIFEILPRISSLTELCYTLYTQHIDLTESEASNLLEMQLAAENRRLKSEIEKIAADKGDRQTLSAIMSYLDEISAESNADIISIKPGEPYQKENLRIMPLAINISADYEGFYNLLRFAEHSAKIILFREIVIKSAEQESGNLNISASIEVYLNL